jgi:hypothetical protein
MRIDTDHINNGHQNNLDDNKCVEKARKKVAAIADRAVLEKETEDGDYNVGTKQLYNLKVLQIPKHII